MSVDPSVGRQEWIEPPVDPDEDEQVAQTLDMAQIFLARLFDNPLLVEDIPDGASVIFLPDDDPELAANQAWGDELLAAGAKVYFARIP